MLWYRGGVYKFGQLLALLLPCLAWGTVAVLVTVNGLRANQSAGATNQVCDSGRARWLCGPQP